MEETLSTLRFAERAGKVKTRVWVNTVTDDATLLRLAQAEILRLQSQLLKARPAASSSPAKSAPMRGGTASFGRHGVLLGRGSFLVTLTLLFW